MKKSVSVILSAILATSMLLGTGSINASAATKVVAFPGAEGGGKFATGGRGGSVYYVTNLNDSGAGSFRDAVSQSNRIVVFKVGGTIELKSDVVVKSNITIAGQTAPGGAGITLKNYKVGLCGSNIIMRFISSRPGERKKNADYDALGGSDGSNSIVDHCSFGWANDEQWGLYSNNINATTQWSIVGPSNSFSYHSKGVHGFAVMFGKYNHTMHHNILAHNVSRNFRGKVEGTGTADFTNNVIYNWGTQTAYGTIGHLNYVGNYLKMGNSTKGGHNYISVDSSTHPENFGMYLTGNKFVQSNNSDYSTFSSNNWSGVRYGKSNGRNEANLKSQSPYKMMVNGEDVSTAKTAESAKDAYEHVLAYAGAGINADSRPEIDKQVMNETRTGTGTLVGARPYNEANATQKATIDKLNIKCGVQFKYPAAVTSGAPKDSDGDGMPDEWEKARGLNPNNKNDANGDYCGQGYTNIEYYLNDLTVNAFPSGTVKTSPVVNGGSTNTENTGSSSTNVTAANIEEGSYMIKNVNSGLYLNVAGGKAQAGTNVQQWGSSSSAPYDTFNIVKASNGYYKIYSQLGDGKTYLLDVNKKSADNGANIGIYTNTNGDNQLFKFVKNSDGSYGILTKISNDQKGLDVANASKSAGGNIQQYSYGASSNQRWVLVKQSTVTNKPTTPTNNNTSTTNKNDTTTNTTQNSKVLSLKADLNSWGAAYQVNITIKNDSKQDVNSWTLKIKKTDLVFDSYWNVNVKEDGDYYVITPKDWNSKILAGQGISFGIQGSGAGKADFSYVLENK